MEPWQFLMLALFVAAMTIAWVAFRIGVRAGTAEALREVLEGWTHRIDWQSLQLRHKDDYQKIVLGALKDAVDLKEYSFLNGNRSARRFGESLADAAWQEGIAAGRAEVNAGR